MAEGIASFLSSSVSPARLRRILRRSLMKTSFSQKDFRNSCSKTTIQLRYDLYSVLLPIQCTRYLINASNISISPLMIERLDCSYDSFIPNSVVTSDGDRSLRRATRSGFIRLGVDIHGLGSAMATSLHEGRQPTQENVPLCTTKLFSNKLTIILSLSFNSL